jgi:TP901 family phage tail tape measure protein
MAQEKVTWVYDAKDKLTPELKGMNQQYDKLQQEAKRTESAVSGGFRRSKQSLTEFVDEIPMAGEALRFLQSPAGIAAGAIGGIGLAAGKAVNEAEQLERQFLKIEQMNLNKSKEEMESYKKSIVETSRTIDQMPETTAKAFFDVQSATGLFGEEVKQVVEQVGTFADATNTDLTSSINAAVKAYRNFDLEAGNLDKLLQANIKTVQTGITTYNQLANVQADYAGTAAAANQTVASANKLFSAFTATSKNVDEAATLTKTAFESLSESSVVNTLEEFNIQVTDAQGNLLKTEPIVRNMVRAFEDLGPEQIRKLKEEVGGTEGMTMLLSQAQSQGEGLLKTFEKFDNTEADISKVTDKAKDDLSEIKEDIMTDISAEFTTIGEGILPIWVDVLKDVKSIMKSINSLSDFSLPDGLNKILNAELPGRLSGSLSDAASKLASGSPFGFEAEDPLKNFQAPAEATDTGIAARKQLDILNSGPSKEQRELQQTLDKQSNILFNRIEPKTTAQQDTEQPDPSKDAQDQQTEQEAQEVVTGGKRTKVVRVSIENLVNDLEFNTTNVQEGFQDMEEGVKQALIRAVQDAEITLSEG